MTDVRFLPVDEAYVKVEADSGITRELQDFFTFEVPGAKFSPAFKRRQWDGLIRLLGKDCLIYKGLVPYVQKYCRDNGYTSESPDWMIPDEFSVAEATAFIDKLNLPMEVRDYQLKAFIHAIRHRRAVLISPTASGKSLIIYLIMRFLRKKTLIIVPTTSLVLQMASDFESYGLKPGMVHKIMSGSEKVFSQQIVVSTWQSIYKLDKSWFKQFEVVFSDECHLSKAKCISSIMQKLEDCVYRIGTTGTLDGTLTHRLVLEGLFGIVRQVTTTKELMDAGHVAELSIKAIVLSYPEEIRQLVADMGYQEELEFLFSNMKRNLFIKNLALSLEGNTLVLFDRVETHGKVLEQLIREATNRPVYYISGEVSGDARDDIRGIVEREDNAILIASSGTTSTGVNIKRLNNLIFTAPSKATIKVLQSIGRILRLADDKTTAVAYDIADDLSCKKDGEAYKNYTLRHFIERIKIYAKERFRYKIYKVSLKQ